MAETNVLEYGTDLHQPTSLSPRMRVLLSVMMFLQYVIWGAWAPVLTLHLQQLPDFKVVNDFLGVSLAMDTKINLIYMTMAIASILSPFVAGQIADRYFSTERFLAISHLVGGALLVYMAKLDTFSALFWVMLAYAIIYSPTVALTNSLTFHHVPNGEKDFSGIRVWGTIGWIAVGWGIGFWLRWTGADVATCLNIAGGVSILMGVFSWFLPHTPPKKNPENPWAFVAALRLMKKRSIAVLVVVSFLVATELQFYFVMTPAFFNQSGGPYNADAIAGILAANGQPSEADRKAAEDLIAAVATDGRASKRISLKELENLASADETARIVVEREAQTVAAKGGARLQESTVPIVMTLGQICEMTVLAILPFFLKRLGFRAMISLGIAAWSVRYIIFAWSSSPGLAVAAQLLHGFGFGFFFVGGFIYADRVAPKDIKASVQALLLLVTYGLGMLVSSLVAGRISSYFERDWHMVFLVPALLTAVCTVLFAAIFREEQPLEEPAPAMGGV